MNNVLIVSASVIRSDPRVRRHIAALKRDFVVTVAGFGTIDETASFEMVSLQDSDADNAATAKALRRYRLITRQYEQHYWQQAFVRSALDQLQRRTFTAILANDVNTLPLAARIAKACNARLIFDAHEYAPREFEDRWSWNAFVRPYHVYLLRRYLPEVQSMTTVGQGIADEYQKRFGTNCRVVTNAMPFVDLAPTSIDPERIRLIHHGAALASRRLEGMIDAMDLLDERFFLDLMLVPGSPTYMQQLRARAEANPRIAFREPVAMDAIPHVLNAYDVGVFLLPPVNFNYRHALPNKFFEFVQGRLAVAVGPSPEMERLVHAHGLGVVARDFSPSAFADVLNALSTDQIMAMKQRAHQVASLLTAEESSRILRECVAGNGQPAG